LKRRLCDGAPRVETPLKAAATGRLETRGGYVLWERGCGARR
jgi:hypothetical protein